MKIESLVLDPVVNFGKVTVSTGYTSADLSIVLNPGEGAKLPDPSVSGWYNLVWWNSTDYADPSDDPNVEIIRVTSNIANTLGILRGQEGTSASNKNIPTKTYKLILSPTKKTITDIQTDISASVKKSGDTMTGTLNLPSNGLVVGTDQLVVSGGNIGMGTTAPGYKLDSIGRIRIKAGTDPSGGIWLRNVLDTTDISFIGRGTDIEAFTGIWSNPNWNLIVKDSGEIGIGTNTPNTLVEMSKSLSGVVGPILRLTNFNNTINTSAEIQFFTDQLSSKIGFLRTGVGNNPNALTFHTFTSDAIGLTEKMRIDNLGNVGIGTTNPGSLLHIDGGTTSGSILTTQRNSTAVFSLLDLYNPNTTFGSGSGIVFSSWQTTSSSKQPFARIQAITGSHGNFDCHLTFSPSSNGIVSEAMRIASGGNVGIGTTSPSTKLDVNGIIKGTNIRSDSGWLAGTSGVWYTIVNIGAGIAIVAASNADWPTSYRLVAIAFGGNVNRYVHAINSACMSVQLTATNDVQIRNDCGSTGITWYILLL